MLMAVHVHATFFLLGDSIINDPNLLKQMVADGCEPANHSYTHTDFTKLNKARLSTSYSAPKRQFRASSGQTSRFARTFIVDYGMTILLLDRSIDHLLK
jgi:peptidoglycan/xylan/chitin deacetylase (PgdA/CDA1 family)